MRELRIDRARERGFEFVDLFGDRFESGEVRGLVAATFCILDKGATFAQRLGKIDKCALHQSKLTTENTEVTERRRRGRALEGRFERPIKSSVTFVSFVVKNRRDERRCSAEAHPDR